jgi:thioesterase domain-containing protein/acyl carrier protein
LKRAVLATDHATHIIADPAATVTDWLSTEVASILRIAAPRADDDFFDLGGDSMSALALFAAVEARFGCALPLTTIYDAPTLSSLAARISNTSAAPPQAACMIPIQRPSASRGAVILIHGIGGHVFDLLRLGALIETPHSVTALRAQGLAFGETPLDRVETMADAYADLIRAACPGQQINLVGYSFGGMVAIEVARRLRADNISVGRVIMLDSYPHPHRWPRKQALDVRLRRIRHQLGVLHAADWSARIAYCRGRLGLGADPGQTATSRAQWLAAPEGATPDIRAVFDAASIAIDHYQPTRFDHPVTFMKPETASAFLPTQPRAVWQPFIAHLDVQTVPGNHVTMLDDHVTELAVLLSRAIARPDRHLA